MFVSAWTLVSLRPLVPLLCSPLAPSLSTPASCSPPRPSRAYNARQPGLHANFATASPPSPAAPLTRCLWRLNRHGGPAKAEFGNTITGKDEKPACFTSAVCYMLCWPAQQHPAGSLYLTALSLKQSLVYLCRRSEVSHVQSNISRIDFWLLFCRKPRGPFLLSPSWKNTMKVRENGFVARGENMSRKCDCVSDSLYLTCSCEVRLLPVRCDHKRPRDESFEAFSSTNLQSL